MTSGIPYNNSPDITQYVDLRIYDKDPTDILRTAMEEFRSLVPDWTPREDNTEVMLMQALAVEVAEAIYAINRLPDAMIVALMRLYGIERDAGAFASTSLEFEVVNTMGYTIPARTRVELPATQDSRELYKKTFLKMEIGTC